MGNLVPSEALIYEQADGVIYARYRDPPFNKLDRWIVGGDPAGVARAQGELLDYSEWKNLCRLAEEYPTLKSLATQLVTTYIMIKDNK